MLDRDKVSSGDFFIVKSKKQYIHTCVINIHNGDIHF